MRNRSIKKAPLHLHHHCPGLPIPRRLIAQTAQAIYAGEKIAQVRSVEVVFCTDPVIKRLNRIYRKKNRPTDVLSFAFDDPDLLGEIYISLPRCKVQSRRFGLICNQEVRRMFVHGMFHLLGYDHQTAKERALMEAREHRYCDF